MRPPILLNKIACTALTATLTVLGPSLPAWAAANHDAVDDMTRQAAALCKEMKIEEAVDLENKAVAQSPNYWLTHSALSILLWKNNKLPAAVKEAEEATRLAPNNALAALNLAQMQQLMGYCDRAVPAYRKAVKLAPADYLAQIGLAQCLILTARTPEAFQVLDQMANKTTSDFDWWYQLGDIYNKLEKAKSARAAAAKAMEVAATTEQKHSSLILLFLTMLKDNDIQAATALREKVLEAAPKDEDVYILALAALYPVSDPLSAKPLLNCAVEQLQDTDGLYRLGKAFEAKASAAADSVKKQWFDEAEILYRAAIKLSPGDPKYHMALAAVQDSQRKFDEMLGELNKAKSLDPNDRLAPYLVSKLNVRINDLAGQLRGKITGSEMQPYQLNLTRADFDITNLHCACKLPTLEYKVIHVSGVTCVVLTHVHKTFKGSLLLDPTFVSINQLFDQVAKGTEYSLQLVSSEQIGSAGKAISVAQSLRDNRGSPARNWSFQSAAPKMPLN